VSRPPDRKSPPSKRLRGSWVVVKDESMAGLRRAPRARAGYRTCGDSRSSRLVYLALEKRILRKKFYNSEGRAADRMNVQAAVVVTLRDVKNLGRATDVCHTLGSERSMPNSNSSSRQVLTIAR